MFIGNNGSQGILGQQRSVFGQQKDSNTEVNNVSEMLNKLSKPNTDIAELSENAKKILAERNSDENATTNTTTTDETSNVSYNKDGEIVEFIAESKDITNSDKIIDMDKAINVKDIKIDDSQNPIKDVNITKIEDINTPMPINSSTDIATVTEYVRNTMLDEGSLIIPDNSLEAIGYQKNVFDDILETDEDRIYSKKVNAIYKEGFESGSVSRSLEDMFEYTYNEYNKIMENSTLTDKEKEISVAALRCKLNGATANYTVQNSVSEAINRVLLRNSGYEMEDMTGEANKSSFIRQEIFLNAISSFQEEMWNSIDSVSSFEELMGKLDEGKGTDMNNPSIGAMDSYYQYSKNNTFTGSTSGDLKEHYSNVFTNVVNPSEYEPVESNYNFYYPGWLM